MRKLAMLLIAGLVFLGSCKGEKEVWLFTSFHEPADGGLRMLYSIDGKTWTDLDTFLLVPEVGNQKVLRDPSIVRGPDGTFHLVWTSSWQGDPGFGYASSPDLLHWSEQRFIPVMAHDTSVVNVWAPELYYEEENGEFLILWASTIPFKFEKGQEEERNNHRMYYTTTKDFEEFSPARLFLDPGFSIIDACIVKRDSRDYVLVLKDNTRPERNLKVAFSESPNGPWEDISPAFTEKYSEGPTVVKTGDEWFIYYDAYREKKYRAAKTKDFINFSDATAEISIPEGHKHGTIFKADGRVLEGLIGRRVEEADPALPSDSVYYSGKTLSNPDYHHGQLPLAKGVHSIQVMRASREHPELADGFGWTYNHGPNLAYWNNRFFLQYLSDEVGEHIPPAQSFLCTSTDGYSWERPVVAFPPYPVPDGTTKEGEDMVARGLTAVMHQRMGFYVSEEGRMLMLGYYGLCLHRRDGPNDGLGIGRVVREIYRDGSFGPIYFIRYNKAQKDIADRYPFFGESPDEGFVKACREMLDKPLIMQQWNEESDRDDPLIPQSEEYKAFNYYTLDDGRVVGLWKHALFEISTNGGRTWNNVRRAPGFVNKNAKFWGQRTSDGNFLTAYNPSEFRWPLALSTSTNGLEYKDLLLLNGEITTMRYGGNYKSYGPQYVRGIQEGNGSPPDGGTWLSYSMNKEDIWVSRVPVPVADRETRDLDEDFTNVPRGNMPEGWNIFSPAWAPVSVQDVDGIHFLVLKDRDPFDYARVDRLFPASRKGEVEFTLMAGQKDHGQLEVELQDRRGNGALRMVLDDELGISVKDGYRMSKVMDFDPGELYDFRITFSTPDRLFSVYVNGELKMTRHFYAPVHSLERICFRTGMIRRFPDVDTPTDQDFDVEDPGKIDPEAVFYLKSLKTSRLE